MVIKDWAQAWASTDLGLLAHIQRYEWVAPLLQGVPSILDDGCGSGYGTHYIATHTSSRVVGVDISKDAISYARRHYEVRSGASLRFERMDSCDLHQLKDTAFDAIVSFDVIEHIPYEKKAQFVAETARLLNPKGKLYIGCPNGRLAEWTNPFHYEIELPLFIELLTAHYENVKLLGQDLVVDGVRQGENFIRYLSNSRMSDFIIVDDKIETAFSLLAICSNKS